MKQRIRQAGIAVPLLAAASVVFGGTQGRAPFATTAHFAFYNEFATNLNDALIAAGVARNDGEPQLFSSGAEAACFVDLPPSQRAGWERAVDYYSEIVSPVNFGSREQFLIRMHLAGFAEELTDAKTRHFIDIASAFLAVATPAYRACRWTEQEAKNREWFEELEPLLATHEQRIARRLAELYQQPLGGLPIAVDVVEIAGWSGANSVLLDPEGGHLLISSSFQGYGALEIVFHEAWHTLMGRRAPMRRALDEAARSLAVPLPGSLWHVLLFHTTGEVVRASLAEAGQADYRPMLLEIYDRGSWVVYRDAIETAWPAYMAGDRDLATAVADLLQSIGEQVERD